MEFAIFNHFNGKLKQTFETTNNFFSLHYKFDRYSKRQLDKNVIALG
jgi:DNA-binding transcriptional regulator GbsR (MarR family)